MVKQTQTIYREFADNLFECAWPFCGVSTLSVNICPVSLFRFQKQPWRMFCKIGMLKSNIKMREMFMRLTLKLLKSCPHVWRH